MFTILGGRQIPADSLLSDLELEVERSGSSIWRLASGVWRLASAPPTAWDLTPLAR